MTSVNDTVDVSSGNQLSDSIVATVLASLSAVVVQLVVVLLI